MPVSRLLFITTCRPAQNVLGKPGIRVGCAGKAIRLLAEPLRRLLIGVGQCDIFLVVLAHTRLLPEHELHQQALKIARLVVEQGMEFSRQGPRCQQCATICGRTRIRRIIQKQDDPFVRILL